MQLIYEGVDITEKVEIREAVTTDCAGGAADCIELTLYNVGDWLNWKPTDEHRAAIEDGGYKSGAMYVDTLKPDGDEYKLVAYSMPRSARAVRWASYEGVTLQELVSLIATELGMVPQLYGVQGGLQYPYLIRRKETALGFLSRILAFEGALVKCYDGKLLAIGLEWAQAQAPARTLELASDLAGAKHNQVTGSYGRCTITSPLGSGSAVHAGSAAVGDLPLGDLPVFDAVQAARWARGRLMMETRNSEQLLWEMDYSAALTGLARFDIEAPGALGGQWIVERVIHDHMEHRSDATFYRCLTGIA